MKIIIKESQINRIIYRYFETVLEDTRVVETEYDDGQNWLSVESNVNGEWKPIVAVPITQNIEETWYSNGDFFNNAWDFFGVDVKTFNAVLKDYLNDKFGFYVHRIV